MTTTDQPNDNSTANENRGGDEHWHQADDGSWHLDPEEGERRLQESMERDADKRVARAWTLLQEAQREIDIALTYARDPELHKVGLGLRALLDQSTRDKSYAHANRLIRGGKTRRRHGTPKRDGELLLSAIRKAWNGTDAEMARLVIGVIPDLGLLPVPGFVFNVADVPRIATVISKFERSHVDPSNLRASARATIAKTERRIARATTDPNRSYRGRPKRGKHCRDCVVIS